jgi:hypothetical protein
MRRNAARGLIAVKASTLAQLRIEITPMEEQLNRVDEFGLVNVDCLTSENERLGFPSPSPATRRVA